MEEIQVSLSHGNAGHLIPSSPQRHHAWIGKNYFLTCCLVVCVVSGLGAVVLMYCRCTCRSQWCLTTILPVHGLHTPTAISNYAIMFIYTPKQSCVHVLPFDFLCYPFQFLLSTNVVHEAKPLFITLNGSSQVNESYVTVNTSNRSYGTFICCALCSQSQSL